MSLFDKLWLITMYIHWMLFTVQIKVQKSDIEKYGL